MAQLPQDGAEQFMVHIPFLTTIMSLLLWKMDILRYYNLYPEGSHTAVLQYYYKGIIHASSAGEVLTLL